jgi:hypothetical protein
MRPLRVFLFDGRHDHGPASTGIAGKLCGQDAKEPDSVQPVGFSAAGASGERPTMTYLIEQVRARCAKRSTLVAGLAITHPVILGAIRDETILRGEGRLNAYAKRPGSTLMRREKAIQRENFSRSIFSS